MEHFLRFRFVEARFLKPNDTHRAAVDLFAGGDVVESAAEWIFADDADIEVVATGLRAW